MHPKIRKESPPGCKFMKRRSLLHRAAVPWLGALVLICGGRLLANAAPAISVGSASGAPGGNASVPAYLFGNTAGVSVQFDLVFDPARITAVSAASDSAAPTHVLASGQPANGVLRIVLYSLSNAQLGSGTLVNFQLAISPAAAEGPLILQVTNAVMADITGSSVQPLSLQPGLLTISAGAGSRLALIARLVNGQVQLQLTGPANKLYLFQSSPDLSNWITVSTNVLTDGQINLTNSPPANASPRFYRAKYAP